MATVQGLVVDNIDFPKKFIREALITGGFSIEEGEFDKCRHTSHVIVWLQSKTKCKIAKDCFLAYQVENHRKLYVKPAPNDATPAPKRELDPNEHPKIARVREHLRNLIRDNDALRTRQAAAPSPPETRPSVSASTITPTAEPEQQPVKSEEEDTKVVVKVERSPRTMEPDQGRKRSRSIVKHEAEEVDKVEDSQEEESSLRKRRRA